MALPRLPDPRQEFPLFFLHRPWFYGPCINDRGMFPVQMVHSQRLWLWKLQCQDMVTNLSWYWCSNLISAHQYDVGCFPWEASCLKTWWILSRPPSRSSYPLSKTLLHLSHVFLPTDRCSTSHDYQDLIVKPSVDFESTGFQHKNVLGFHTKSSWAETEAGSHRSRPEGHHWMAPQES